MVISIVTFENKDNNIHKNSTFIEIKETDLNKIWNTIKNVYISKISSYKTCEYDNVCINNTDLLNSYFIDALNAKILNYKYNNYDKQVNAYISYSYFSINFNTNFGFYKIYIVNKNQKNNCMSKAAETALYSKSSNISNIVKYINKNNKTRNTLTDYKNSDIFEHDISSLRYIRDEAKHLIKLCNNIIEHITDSTIYPNT